MICEPCVRGAHCGPPGSASASCPCQHRPPRGASPQPLVITPAEVEVMAGAIGRMAEERALISQCQDSPECCPGDSCRLDAWRAARVGLPPSGDAGASRPHPEASGPSDDDTRPFTTVLTEWMTQHRAGHFVRAAELRTALIKRLDRLGRRTP
jgi:hypothetical protein